MNTNQTIEKYFNILSMRDKYEKFLPILKESSEACDIKELTKIDLEKKKDPVLNLAWLLYRCAELEERYEKLGIDHSVFLDTISDIKIWTDTYFSYTDGEFGLAEINWLLYHIEFRLFRLGRLQFAFGNAERDCHEYGLVKGERIIEVHIPEGASLSPEACDESFNKANEFFKKHFPDYKFRFYTCHSWLLDGNLKKLLKEDANILKFAARFDTIDFEESYAGIRYVFNWNDTKESILKESYPEGSLKQRMRDYIARDGILTESYGIIKKDRNGVKNTYKGYDLANLKRECVKEAATLSRIAGTEGAVLLKNENVLPFEKSKTVSVFGRTQIDYVKSGTGSGGLVNTEYAVNVIDGLKNRISVNEELLNIYREWLKDNPFDVGNGWATEPWHQKEMPLTDEMCKHAAENSDYAVVIIGRTAGEDRDNFAVEGSYLLTFDEEQMISAVCRYFKKVCVILNTGNIIDMKWVEKYNVPAVLYSWHGGSEGGNSLADILLGDADPSGRLADTIAYNIEDYPSHKNHGDAVKNVYEEDIYVGYRYFETFAKDKVIYPFGFGLSYTKFAYDYTATCENDTVFISVKVKNTGNRAGKTVIQVYYGAPDGKLGNPAKALIRYQKTKLLEIGEEEYISICFPVSDMSSYDDNRNFAYMLLNGDYVIYAGENVRDAHEILKIRLEERVTKQLRQALAPVTPFDRLVSVCGKPAYQASTTRTYEIESRKKEHLTEQKVTTGNRGIKLIDVAQGKYSLTEFTEQLTVEELSYLVKGEGMNSPKVTAGTGGAFGGVTDELLQYGIPIVCVTDGPSGIRMDSGEKATLIPNGACLASTWNNELVRELYYYIGVELRAHEIDILLGPGINIHRHPLNGRNFEYFSEDPYLAGMLAGSCTLGLSDAGVMGTIKHFACNSQEDHRRTVDSIVSERALREIYLKPFEIAVKEGKATAVMTSYNKINGTHACSDYDLCTSLLRDEWNFSGIVMTDWWANPDDSGKLSNLKVMIEAQNDLYMVTPSSKENHDNIIESVNKGELDISLLRKCAENLLQFMLTSPAMNREAKQNSDIDITGYKTVAEYNNILSGMVYDLDDADVLELRYKTKGSELGQYVISIFDGEDYLTCALVKGTGESDSKAVISIPTHTNHLNIKFSSAFEYLSLKGLKK